VTGRPALACALYAAFLAAWALGAAMLRREVGPYLPLGMALLEATLLLGAILAAVAIGDQVADRAAIHAGYLLASIAILPLGWLLARTADGHRDPLTLFVALAALAVVVLRVDATAG
jgi:hypothetical protein